jgi:hypothetical protein
MNDVDEQQQYLVEMLDVRNPNHLNFIQDFSRRIKSSAKISALAPPGMVAYKKGQQLGGARSKNKAMQKKPTEMIGSNNKENSPGKVTTDPKKATKFVPLFATDGKVQFSL